MPPGQTEPAFSKKSNKAFFTAMTNFLAACPQNVPLGTGFNPNNGCPRAAPQGGFGHTASHPAPAWGAGHSGINYQTPAAQEAASKGFFGAPQQNLAIGQGDSPCGGTTPPQSNRTSCPIT